MYTIAFDFDKKGRRWKGFGIERGKNLTAVKMGLFIMWIIPMSFTEFIGRISKSKKAKPVASNPDDHKYRLN